MGVTVRGLGVSVRVLGMPRRRRMHAAVVTGVERPERPGEDVKLVSVLIHAKTLFVAPTARAGIALGCGSLPVAACGNESVVAITVSSLEPR